MKNILPQYVAEMISMQQVLLGLLLVVVFSPLVRWHYLRFSSVFTDRTDLANNPSLVAATMPLAIVVKAP